MPKVALITGVTGQDGSYLAEHLLSLGYEVHGMIRRSSSFNTQRVDHLYHDPHEQGAKFTLWHGDMTDPMGMRRIIGQVRPDEVYNLAAQSHVKTSFDQPIYTADTIVMGTIGLLEAVRDYRDTTNHEVRYYQASSSEMFGSSPPPQSEATPFRPRSPYACAKVYAFYQTVNYREAYGLFAANGILFNHESPRRLETFVTRKITRAVTRMKHGLQDKLYLGNLAATRDWGYAGDYVKAMRAMLQADAPSDYVVATGVAHSVREWLEWAFLAAGFGPDDWRRRVATDSRYYRPSEVDALRGNASKAIAELGWRSAMSAHRLCGAMVAADDLLARQELDLTTPQGVVGLSQTTTE